MKIAVGHTGRFAVTAPIGDVYALLTDVPRSVSHFPDVATLAPISDDTYPWEMQPVGALGIAHQVVYACRYVHDDDALGLAWTPVDGVGNGRIGGRWKLTPQGQGTQVDFATDGELDVPIPMPLRAVARPFVEQQFRQQVQRYLDNLRQAMGAAQ